MLDTTSRQLAFSLMYICCDHPLHLFWPYQGLLYPDLLNIMWRLHLQPHVLKLFPIRGRAHLLTGAVCMPLCGSMAVGEMQRIRIGMDADSHGSAEH